MDITPSTITPPHPTNLSIITHLIATYKLWHEFLPHIPKDSRYTLGAKVDRSLTNAAELLFIASYLGRDRKAPYLQKANADLDLAKFFLQILWEVNALDNKKYAILSEKFAEVGRMLGGWIKGLERKPPARGREV